jgi:predicted GIY-YIG superfamily endonuclease
MTVSINGTSTNAVSVYWIRCHDHTDIRNQGYVGVSNNASKRFLDHKRSKQNPHLTYAIQKYGWDNLIKSEILVSTQEYCLDIERKLRPTNNIGWNIVMGGGLPPNAKGKKLNRTAPSWNKGKTYSAETRKKISDAVTLAMQDPARREINRITHLGNTYRKGISLSPQTIEKIRTSKLGVPSKKKGVLLTAEQRQNICILVRKNPWVCPHCQTVGYGVGAKNRWHFDNCIGKRK